MTQVIITESDNKASSVEIKPTPLTTDVVKTYFVTYTYFSTMLDGESTVVHTEVATSSDVVTEKFVIAPKRTSASIADSDDKTNENINLTKAPELESSSENPINVFATKTYLTTFTYFTTLLQDNSSGPSTIVSSRTNVIQNIVTETLDTELLDSDYLSSLRSSLQTDGHPIVATATLNDGQKMEITAVGEHHVKQTLSPAHGISSSFEETSSKNNVITGSTIIFFDENDQIDSYSPLATKTLTIDSAGHANNNMGVTSENQDVTESNTENAESLSAAESQALVLAADDLDENKQSYETSILASSIVTKNGATLLPGSQVIKFKEPNGNVSIIPVSDPVTKHPDGTNTAATQSNTAVSNFLSLGSLGINSLNALGPVINAMAGLIKNNLNKEHRRRNDTVGVSANEPTDVHLSKNPLMTYAGPKPPPVRSPIYIPVGGLAADSVAEESQHFEGHNVFPDTHQRNNNLVVLGKPTMESPLLAGGIPISPGQVITANSDVIIGKPAVHGPRPPEFGSKPFKKDDIPIGMKPPPLPKNKPKWPVRDHSGHYIPLGHHPSREGPYRNPLRETPYTPYREHLQNYDTMNYNQEFFKQQENPQKNTYNHNIRPLIRPDSFNSPPRNDPSNINLEQRPQYQNKPLYPAQHNTHDYNTVPNNNYFDARPTSQLDTEALNLLNNNVEYVNPIQHAPILLSDNTDLVDQSAINPLLVNIQPSQVANVIIPHGSSTALIYNGQHTQKGEIFNDPSPYPDAEVDHVVDALSTARPAPEGEGITHAARVPINTDNVDVPVAPHGINVAGGNQQVYKPIMDIHSQPGKNNNQNLYQSRPSNQIDHKPDKSYQTPDQNQRIPVQSNKNQNFNNQQQYYIQHNPSSLETPGLGEFLQPPPPPPNRYLGSEKRPDDDEYVFGDEPIDQEGGEVTQESNARPLIPGQLPSELSVNPSTSMPIDPIHDERQGDDVNINYKQRPDRLARPNNDINFSVVNSKPVQLDGISSINNQAPIINGRPGINQFKDNSQATLAVGSPTKLKPDGSATFTQNRDDFKNNNRPLDSNYVKPALFAAVEQEQIHDDRPVSVETIYYGNKHNQNKHSKPIHDITVPTMSLDNMPPPPPVYETPPPPQKTGQTDLDIQANTPRPFSANPTQGQFDRNSQQDDSVVGLSPPPPEIRYPSHEDITTIPVLNLPGPQRRPTLQPPRKHRPPPPYKFEIPQPPQVQEPLRPTLPPNLEPPKPPLITEPQPPPLPEEEYFHKPLPQRPPQMDTSETLPQWNSQNKPKPIIVAQQDIINPVLKGVMTVEEQPQQPEVITANSKVTLTNIIKGQIPKPEGAIKITGSQPALQTVVVGKPVPVPVTDIAPNVNIKPTAVHKSKESEVWKDEFIVGSETIIDDHHHHHVATPAKEESQSSSTKEASVLVTTGVTTIFGNLFTRPTSLTKIIKPTKSMQSHHTVISMVVEPKVTNKNSSEHFVKTNQSGHHEVVLTIDGPDDNLDQSNDIITAPPPTTFVITHTQTTTVTTTETTVVHSKGQEPSTQTLVLTKTQISTLLNTVTEVHTLVKQTSILSTVTSTVPMTQVIPTRIVEKEEYPVPSKGDQETTKSPLKEKPADDPHNNESIFVVMTDKKSGTIEIPALDNQPPPEIQVPDETNEISPNVLLGSVLTHQPSDDECRPGCKAARNELCQKIDNVMRCVCRPGFARMFPDRPCKRKYMR